MSSLGYYILDGFLHLLYCSPHINSAHLIHWCHWCSILAACLTSSLVQFFAEYNSKLLESTNYITRRQAVKVWLLRTLNSFTSKTLILKCGFMWKECVYASKHLIELNATQDNTYFDIWKNIGVVCAWSPLPHLNMVFQLVMCIILDRSQSRVPYCKSFNLVA